jgi:hypothetical protein
LYKGFDAEEVGRIKLALKDSGIKYEITTKRNAGPFSKESKPVVGSGSFLARGGNPSASSAKVGEMVGYDDVTYLYQIFVDKKNLDNANAVVYP